MGAALDDALRALDFGGTTSHLFPRTSATRTRWDVADERVTGSQGDVDRQFAEVLLAATDSEHFDPRKCVLESPQPPDRLVGVSGQHQDVDLVVVTEFEKHCAQQSGQPGQQRVDEVQLRLAAGDDPAVVGALRAPDRAEGMHDALQPPVEGVSAGRGGLCSDPNRKWAHRTSSADVPASGWEIRQRGSGRAAVTTVATAARAGAGTAAPGPRRAPSPLRRPVTRRRSRS